MIKLRKEKINKRNQEKEEWKRKVREKKNS